MNIKSLTLSLLLCLAAIPAWAQSSYDDPMSQALMQAFDELLAEDPRDPETLVRRAGLYYAHHDYVKALDDVNTAMKYFPADDDEARYPAYQLRAKIYQRQKKYQDALADLNEVLKVSPRTTAPSISVPVCSMSLAVTPSPMPTITSCSVSTPTARMHCSARLRWP